MGVAASMAGAVRSADGDENARQIIAPRTMIPARKLARWVSRSSGFMLFPRTHETRCAGCNLSDDGMDDTFVLVRSRRSLPPHVARDRRPSPGSAKGARLHRITAIRRR